MPTYGAIYDTDIATLEAGLRQLLQRFEGPLHVLEVGIAAGRTSLGMKEFVEGSGRQIVWVGVDNRRVGPVVSPFEGATLVLGSSEIVCSQIPSGQHLVFIDGCHCLNHVILDVINYGEKVVPGGMMMLHDTGFPNQGQVQEVSCPIAVQGVNKCVVEVREAVRKLGLFDNHPHWKLLVDAGPASLYGGVMTFERKEK